MKTKSFFGHVGAENGGHSIAGCRTCNTSVFMSSEQRDSVSGNLLYFLDKCVDCCSKPDYDFYPVVLFANINRVCLTCGQTIQNKE